MFREINRVVKGREEISFRKYWPFYLRIYATVSRISHNSYKNLTNLKREPKCMLSTCICLSIFWVFVWTRERLAQGTTMQGNMRKSLCNKGCKFFVKSFHKMSCFFKRYFNKINNEKRKRVETLFVTLQGSRKNYFKLKVRTIANSFQTGQWRLDKIIQAYR